MPGFTAADPTAPSAVLYRGLRVMRPLHPRVVLDIGCGAGRESVALARETGARVLAIDLDAEALRAAPRSQAVLYLRADACRLPLASGIADVVYSFGLLPSLAGDGYDKIRTALAEMRRAISAHGASILSTLADFRDDGPLRSLTGAEVSQVMRGAFIIHELIGLRDTDAVGRRSRYWYIHALPDPQPTPPPL